VQAPIRALALSAFVDEEVRAATGAQGGQVIWSHSRRKSRTSPQSSAMNASWAKMRWREGTGSVPMIALDNLLVG